jgi:hypothetical protein
MCIAQDYVVSRQTSHGGTGFTAPHIGWLFIRFQFLETKPTEERYVYFC